MRIGGMYNIDFAKVSEIPKFEIIVKDGDSKRSIGLILSENSKAVNLNDYNVTVAAKKGDGTNIFNDVKTIDALAGMCEFEITEQMLALNIDLPCEIVLYGADGTVASSSNFVISKIANLRNDNSIVSSNEFKALTETMSNYAYFKSNLVNKMNRGEAIKVAQIDKNTGKLDQSYMSEEFLSQIAGNTPINTIPADGSITTKKLTSNCVGFEALNMFDKTFEQKNVFNKDDVNKNGYYNGLNGEFIPSSIANQSNYIEVIPSEKIILKGSKGRTYNYIFTDINKTFISGGTINNDSSDGTIKITVPNNSSIACFSTAFLTSEYDTFEILKDVLIPKSNNELIQSIINPLNNPLEYSNLVEGHIFKKGTIPVEKTNILKIEPDNLYDKNNITLDKYINISGAWENCPGISQSNLIDAKKGDIFEFSTSIGTNYTYTVFDENNNVIQAFKFAATQNFSTIKIINDNVCYFSTAFLNSQLENMIIKRISAKENLLSSEMSSIINKDVSKNLILRDEIVDYRNTTFFDKIEFNDGLNLFNKNDITTGGYYSADTFKWISSDLISQSSDICILNKSILNIRVKKGGTYHYILKDRHKKIIKGSKIYPTSENTDVKIKIPESAFFYSMAVYNEDLDYLMITADDELPIDYTPYDPSSISTYVSFDKDFEIAIQNIDTSKNLSKNKNISILGDSISTFAGWIPEGNLAFYNGTNGGINDVSQTWWKRTIDTLNMNLCINNSWSGSRVTTTGGNESSGCMSRCENLHNGEILPDVIIVYMGINDFNNNVQLGDYNGTQDFPTTTTTFKEAYSIMLNKILTKYQNAKVYVCTLPYCDRNEDDNVFPEKNNNGVLLSTWNNAIREIADLFGLDIIEISKCGLTFQNRKVYTNDDLHPNIEGMELVSRKVINTIKNL